MQDTHATAECVALGASAESPTAPLLDTVIELPPPFAKSPASSDVARDDVARDDVARDDVARGDVSGSGDVSPHPATAKDSATASGAAPSEALPRSGPLVLGMSMASVRHFVSTHPLVTSCNLSTGQIKDAIVKPESVASERAFLHLYAGLSDAAGAPFVAPATVFVSHAWSYSFGRVVVDVLEQYARDHPEPTPYFWIDLFANDQNSVDGGKDFKWFCDAFRGSIEAIGRVLLVMSPWNDPMPMKRAWCLFELASVLSAPHVRMDVRLPLAEVGALAAGVRAKSGTVVQALSDIQAEKAEASVASDRDMIFEAIRRSEGGFLRVNRLAKDFLRAWYVAQLQALISAAACGGSGGAAGDFILMHQVANVLYDVGDYDGAVALYNRALGLKVASLGAEHVEVARTLNCLGLTFSSKGDLPRAGEYYERALRMRLALLGRDHPDVGTSYNNLGLLCKNRGLFDAAVAHHEEALRIRVAAFGDAHSEVATVLNNLGIAYRCRGQLALAVEHHERAIAMKAASVGPAHPSIATYSANLALVHSMRGAYAKSLECNERALCIQLSALGEGHPDLAASLSGLGYAHFGLGDYRAASSFYEKALAKRLATLGPAHATVARMRSCLGEALLLDGHVARGREHLEAALRAWAAAVGEASPDLGRTCSFLGLACALSGDMERGMQLCARALALVHADATGGVGAAHPAIESASGKGSVAAAEGIDARGIEPADQGAAGAATRAEAGAETAVAEHPDAPVCLQNAGRARRASAQPKASLDFFERALVSLARLFGSEGATHALAASLHADCSLALLDGNDIPRAIERAEKAVSIGVAALGMKNALVVEWTALLSRLGTGKDCAADAVAKDAAASSSLTSSVSISHV